MVEIVDPATGEKWSSVEEFRGRRGSGARWQAEFEILQAQKKEKERVREQAAQTQRKQQLSQEIDKRRGAEMLTLRKEFQQNLIRAKSLNERVELAKKLNQDLARAKYKASAEKVEAGIITKAVAGGVTITPDITSAYKKALEGTGLTQEEVIRLQQAGAEFEEVKPQVKPQITIPESYLKKEGIPVPQKYTIGAEGTLGAVPLIPPKSKLGFWKEAREIVLSPLAMIREAGAITEKGVTKGLEIPGYKGMVGKAPPTEATTFFRRGEEGEMVFLKPSEEYTYWKPKEVGRAAGIGMKWGLLYATPNIILAPAFVLEGTETALNEKFTIKERLLGVVEAEAGLLMGGLSFLNYLNKIGLAGKKISIREFEGIKGKKAQVEISKWRQKYELEYAKQKQAKASFAELKSAIKRSSAKDLITWKQRQINLIRGNAKLTSGEKQQLLILLDSTILEAKTGEKIILEGGIVDLDKLKFAQGKLIPPKPDILEVSKPLIVGGEGVLKAPSIWTGKGMYERTEGVAIGLKPSLFFKPKLIQVSGQQLTQLPKQELASLLSTSLLQKSQLLQLSKQQLLQKTLQQQKLLFKELQIQKQQEKLKYKQVGGYRFVRPATIPKLKLKLPKILFPKLETPEEKEARKKILKKEFGFIAQLKQRGVWTQISKKVLSKKDAVALGGFATDNTLSRQFRIKQSNKKITSDFKGLFASKKFRDYTIKKGKKVPMKDQFIEKVKYALDMPKEKQTIQQFRKSAMFKRKFMPKKKKKKVRESTTKNFLLRGGFKFFK